MLQIMINLSIILTSLIFIQMNHPLAMGFMLLIQTIFASLITGIIAKTFWFSYILFLVFLGGMLVLFIYVTSLASNEMFSFSVKTFIFSILFLLLMIFMVIMLDTNLFMTFIENNEMNEISLTNSFIQENSFMLNKLYNFPSNLMTIILINYLLMTLVAIVKITNIFYGPIRQMN